MSLDKKIKNLHVKEIIWMMGNYHKDDHIACNYKFKKESYTLTYAPTSLIYKIEEEHIILTRFICIRIQEKENEDATQKRIEQKNYKL